MVRAGSDIDGRTIPTRTARAANRETAESSDGNAVAAIAAATANTLGEQRAGIDFRGMQIAKIIYGHCGAIATTTAIAANRKPAAAVATIAAAAADALREDGGLGRKN